MLDNILFDLIKEAKRVLEDTRLTDAEVVDRIDVLITMADNEIDSTLNAMAASLVEQGRNYREGVA